MSRIEPEAQRTAAYYLLVVGCDVPGALAAKAAGCSKQNISKALRAVEDRRAGAVFDAEMTALERQLFGEV